MTRHFRRDERHGDNALCNMAPPRGGDALTNAKEFVDCWRCVHLLLGRPLPTEPRTPEHDRLKRAKKTDDATQLVGEFCDWLNSNGYVICARSFRLRPIENWKPLLSRFFGVSPDALEAEKQSLLRYARETNAAQEWAADEGRRALAAR